LQRPGLIVVKLFGL